MTHLFSILEKKEHGWRIHIVLGKDFLKKKGAGELRQLELAVT